jgi:radical SAM protein with 4Fe4S-binding SPASM domain
MREKIGEAKFTMIQKIVRDLAKNRFRDGIDFSLGGYGEPLLYPHLIKVIELIKKEIPGSYVVLTTNGLLLNEDISVALLASGLDYIRFSANAVNPHEYKRLMGVDAFGQLEDNIKQFLRLRNSQQMRTKVCIQILETARNLKDFAEFQANWQPFLADRDFIALRKLESKLGRINLRSLYNGEVPEAHCKEGFERRWPCIALWKDIAIDVEGNVYACCEALALRDTKSRLTLGNVKNTCLTTLMRSKSLESLRELHLTNDYNAIQECALCNKYINYPCVWSFENGRWKEK